MNFNRKLKYQSRLSVILPVCTAFVILSFSLLDNLLTMQKLSISFNELYSITNPHFWLLRRNIFNYLIWTISVLGFAKNSLKFYLLSCPPFFAKFLNGTFTFLSFFSYSPASVWKPLIILFLSEVYFSLAACSLPGLDAFTFLKIWLFSSISYLWTMLSNWLLLVRTLSMRGFFTVFYSSKLIYSSYFSLL